MDGVSAAASIIAIIQLTTSLVDYIGTVKNASKEQKQLKDEAASAYGVLFRVYLQVQKANGDEAWYETVRQLLTPSGAFGQYLLALERLGDVAKDRKTLGGRVVNALSWKFRKDDVEQVLKSIDRVKSSANLALSNDTLYVIAWLSIERTLTGDIAL